MVRVRTEELLLGEWACLGVLCEEAAHGYDVAKRLSPTGDLGRVWSLSRPLTYRAIEQLVARGYAESVSEEPGRSGGNRTIMAPTSHGRQVLLAWLHEPVPHLRDVRSELLVKLVLCSTLGLESTPLISAQRQLFEPMIAGIAADSDSDRGGSRSDDPVEIWRQESSQTVLRFLDRLAGS
jgi:DNA-binding PadR family transcriptional regulator